MPPRLLIVDDEPILREVLPQIVQRTFADWEIDTADSGTSALALLQTSNYDLVLADLIMPGMTGADLARHVSSSGPAVILMSGAPDLVAQAESSGAFGYLPKPIERSVLHQLLSQALRRRSPSC